MTDSPSGAHRASDETSAGRVWKRPRGRARYPDPVVLDAPPASAPAAGSERRLVLSLGERAAVRPPAQLPPVTQTPATRTPGGPSAVSEPDLPTRASGRRLIAGGRFDGPLDDRDEAATRTRVGSHAAPSPVVPPVRGADELRRPPANSSPGVEPDAATLVMDIVQPAATSAETAATTSAAAPPAAPAPRPPRGGPLVVGIVNVTPDSFSDGGRYVEVDDALRHARALVEAGADVIDVGGESTRPGSARVAPIDEQRRVLPVIRQLASEGVRVSIDTMNAATAYAAVEAGADIVNDVSGGLADRFMAQAVADTGSTFVAMHWRGPLDGSDRPHYRDVVTDVHDELQQRVADLVAQGIDPSRLVLDPGLGFSKDAAQNWQVLAGLRGLGRLGLPLMVGASRKRFLGELLPEGAPIEARDQATAVVSVLAALEGVWAVRVHDVAATRAALDVWQAWQQGGRSAGAAKSTLSARHA